MVALGIRLDVSVETMQDDAGCNTAKTCHTKYSIILRAFSFQSLENIIIQKITFGRIIYLSHLFPCHSSQIHGEQNSRLRKLGNTDHGSSRTVITQYIDICAIHLFEVLHVLQKDIHVDDVLKV